jgi:AcrR family transcriptional regulator
MFFMIPKTCNSPYLYLTVKNILTNLTAGHLVTVEKLIIRFLGFMGVVERKEREKEQRRLQIIDAAERIFFSKGFDNASMQDVADESELSKGTIYLYFSSKNELCMAIIVRSLQTIRSEFELIAQQNIKGLDKLNQIAETFLQFTLDHPKYYRALLTFRNHSIECSETGQIYQSSLKQNKTINDIIKEIIESGKVDGSISEKTNAEKLAQAIWGNLTGFLPGCILSTNQRNKQSAIKPDVVLRYIFELIQNAIKSH